MATCRKCIHWKKCSKVDGRTRYYGKEIACNNVEEACEWFISIANVAPIADTVQKMKDRLINYESYDNGGGNYVVSVDDIRIVAKEMLEGEK